MKKLKSSDDLNSVEEKGLCRDSDSNRKSSYHGYYYKSDHGRKGLSSFHSSRYDRDEGRENSRSNPRRSSFRYKSFNRRRGFDNYRILDRGGGLLYAEDRIHRSESFSMSRRDFPKGFRSERERPPQKGGISSWERFEENDEYDHDGNSSSDSARGDRSGFEDRCRVLLDAKTPSWSKKYCSYQSKSDEVRKSEELEIVGGECSEMEEGELEPDIDPELEPVIAEHKSISEIKANNDILHDHEGVKTPEEDLKPRSSSSSVEEEIGLESEKLSVGDLEVSDERSHEDGGCDEELEAGLSEIGRDVEGNASHDSQEKLTVIVEGDNNPNALNCARDYDEDDKSFMQMMGLKENTTNVEEFLPLRDEAISFNHKNHAVNFTSVLETNTSFFLENKSFGPKVVADELTLVLEDRGKTVASSSSYVDALTGAREEECMGIGLKNYISPTAVDLEMPSSRGFELFSCQKLERIDKLKDRNLTLEPLDLSLSLPNVLLPISACDLNPSTKPFNHADIQLISTQAETSSVSMSFSGSQQISHNPSCSLTQNSFDNYELSVGSRPIFLGVDGCSPNNIIQKETPSYQRILINKNGSVHQPHASKGMVNDLFSPLGRSEVLDRQLSIGSLETLSELSKERKKILKESNTDSNCVYVGGTNAKLDMRNGSDYFETLITLMVSEPIHVTAREFRKMNEQSLARLREGISGILTNAALQKSPYKWSDTTMEMLLKCPKAQLEIMVSLKTGLVDFLQQHDTIPVSVLAEIILDIRCKNINCKHLLPVDGCECKICSLNKGFCNSCMCIICLKFDNASNTCSWVGCDVCLHWCHSDCSIRESLIRNSNTACGSTETQFHCAACGHPSEMFGFIKEIFQNFAKTWPRQTLMKELKYVMTIFSGSMDVRGKRLHGIAEEMISRLANGSESDFPDPYNPILSFLSESSTTANFGKTMEPDSVFPSKTSQPDRKNPVFNELDSIIKIKQEEAKLFQARANEARREANGLKQIVIAKRNKIEEEYASRVAKLGLLEAEQMRKEKQEQLQALERSHREYFNMKMRMEGDIKNLLLKMEATKQNLAL